MSITCTSLLDHLVHFTRLCASVCKITLLNSSLVCNASYLRSFDRSSSRRISRVTRLTSLRVGTSPVPSGSFSRLVSSVNGFGSTVSRPCCRLGMKGLLKSGIAYSVKASVVFFMVEMEPERAEDGREEETGRNQGRGWWQAMRWQLRMEGVRCDAKDIPCQISKC